MSGHIHIRCRVGHHLLQSQSVSVVPRGDCNAYSNKKVSWFQKNKNYVFGVCCGISKAKFGFGNKYMSLKPCFPSCMFYWCLGVPFEIFFQNFHFFTFYKSTILFQDS